MPEDTKKQKGKSEAKEQRKRRGRQAAAPDKKLEKESDGPKHTDAKASEKPQKPACEPPPEFYKNLKRETDDIIKITEEANSKYKKKEILSNWSKYEMPIESYDEIDEQENLGADYETLASAPLSVGSHFQFKHEKSWDTNTGPSIYDKYFEINMQCLNTALSTIPFLERNSLDMTLFSETDIQNMNHRATKFKQKYYKDKKYTTPELEAQEKILNSLSKSEDSNENLINKEKEINLDNAEFPDQGSNIENKNTVSAYKETNLDISTIAEIVSPKKAVQSLQEDNTNKETSNKIAINKNEEEEIIATKEPDIFEDDNLHETSIISKKISCEDVVAKLDKIDLAPKSVTLEAPEPAKNPVIESPEDLEKWLDDFLDG